MTKKEILKEINKFKFSGKEVLVLANNIENIENIKKNNKKINKEKFINSIIGGTFIHYAIIVTEGAGIIEFAKKYKLNLEEKNGIYSAKDFIILKDARNLVLASLITRKKISLTLLRKITNQNNSNKKIIEIAKKIKPLIIKEINNNIT